jgi:serine/alanine adding enzyme
VLEPGSATLLHTGDGGGDVVFPCIVRELPEGGGSDVVTPYGYGGPVAVGPDPPVERFWELFENWCAERGVVTSFVRFHPLFANHRLAPSSMRLERLGGTVAWRLGADDLAAGMDGKHRNTCRKALRSGVTVALEAAPADLGGFVPLYEETMRRQDASGFYFFPEPYWESLSAGLHERLVLAVARLEGEAVAAALLLAGPRWLHYHLGATAESARRVGASNLLLYEAALWGRERGLTRFHLGGGVGGRDDSLLAFKRSFDSGGLCESVVGKAVHDPDAYRALTGQEEVVYAGFFPAYRVPGALSQTAGTPKRR